MSALMQPLDVRERQHTCETYEAVGMAGTGWQAQDGTNSRLTSLGLVFSHVMSWVTRPALNYSILACSITVRFQEYT